MALLAARLDVDRFCPFLTVVDHVWSVAPEVLGGTRDVGWGCDDVHETSIGVSEAIALLSIVTVVTYGVGNGHPHDGVSGGRADESPIRGSTLGETQGGGRRLEGRCHTRGMSATLIRHQRGHGKSSGPSLLARTGSWNAQMLGARVPWSVHGLEFSLALRPATIRPLSAGCPL